MTENEVTLEKVRLIDENGNQMGILSMKEAFQMALDRKLDLAIVSETSVPKIAKIVNYGKILYEQKKAKKNQKSAIKLNKITELLNEGDKVRVYLVLKGREVDYFNLASEFMERVIADLKGIGKTEDKIKLEGKNIILNFVRG